MEASIICGIIGLRINFGENDLDNFAEIMYRREAFFLTNLFL